MTKAGGYYDVRTAHKRIKSEIASSYLVPWASIVGRHAELHYLDLFSGRGTYKDGNPATPVMVLDELERTSKSMPWILEKLTVSFFEGNTGNFKRLLSDINSHIVFSKLKKQPRIQNVKIDPLFISSISSQIDCPTYTFIDPFGYKGFSLEVVDIVTKEWGCDCLFYLSISGLVRNVLLSEQEVNMIQFFGKVEYKELKEKVKTQDKFLSRSQIILAEIEKILKGKRKYYLVPYLVEFDNLKRESHYLIFVSKNETGFKIMRDIMIKRGMKDKFGMPQLVFSPKRESAQQQYELEIVNIGESLDINSKRLKYDFKGKELQFPMLCSECVKKGYLLQDAHIRIVVKQLEYVGQVGIKRFDKFGNVRADSEITKYDVIKF